MQGQMPLSCTRMRLPYNCSGRRRRQVPLQQREQDCQVRPSSPWCHSTWGQTISPLMYLLWVHKYLRYGTIYTAACARTVPPTRLRDSFTVSTNIHLRAEHILIPNTHAVLPKVNIPQLYSHGHQLLTVSWTATANREKNCSATYNRMPIPANDRHNWSMLPLPPPFPLPPLFVSGTRVEHM